MSNGQRVVVTAAAAGIGLLIVKAFAARGRSFSDVTTDALSMQSIKRFVDPNDIAALCIVLASDAAKSISGQTIPSTATPRPRSSNMIQGFSARGRVPSCHVGRDGATPAACRLLREVPESKPGVAPAGVPGEQLVCAGGAPRSRLVGLHRGWCV
jgi:hypothetical protein